MQATLDPFGGKFIVQGAQIEVVEGAWPGSAIVLRGGEYFFMSSLSALNWTFSELRGSNFIAADFSTSACCNQGCGVTFAS